jgi:cytochrome c oxidase subunit 2
MQDLIYHKLLKLPVLASEHGRDVDNLIVYMHVLMGALFVGWAAFFLYTLFRFRRSRQPKADHIGVTSHASTWVEGGVAAVEAILLIGFAVPLWAKVADGLPKREEAVVVRVTAEQFSWNSRYPGKDGKFGRQDPKLVRADNPFGLVKDDPDGKDDVTPPLKDIRVPVNKPVIVEITSKDVIHCFKVVPLRVTQDAIPGMMVPVHFKATKEGKYLITCAQLCGNGHYSMNGFFTVESQENFDKWLAEKSKSAAPGAFD